MKDFAFPFAVNIFLRFLGLSDDRLDIFVGWGKDLLHGEAVRCGRYCDLFQKREGAWRIAERTVVYDWLEEQIPPAGFEPERFGPRQPIGAPHPVDPVYALTTRRGRGKRL